MASLPAGWAESSFSNGAMSLLMVVWAEAKLRHRIFEPSTSSKDREVFYISIVIEWKY